MKSFITVVCVLCSIFSFSQTDELDSLLQQGSILCQSGQLTEGMATLSKAKDGYQEIKEWPKFAESSISYWFAYYFTTGESDTALDAFEEVIAIIQSELPDSTSLLADVISYKANLEHYASYLRKSLASNLKALALYELDRSNNLQSIGSVYNNLGALFSKDGNKKKAEIYYLKSVEIKTEFDHKGIPYSALGHLHTYLNLSSIYYAMGEYQKFLAYQEKIDDKLANSKRRPEVERKLFTNYVKYYLREGNDLNKSKFYLDKLSENSEATTVDFRTSINTMLLKSEYALKTKDTTTAEDLQLQMVERAKEFMGKNPFDLISYYTSISEFYTATGDFNKASTWTDKSLAIISSIEHIEISNLDIQNLNHLATAYGAKTAIHYLDQENTLKQRNETILKYGEAYMNIFREYTNRMENIDGSEYFIDFDVVVSALIESHGSDDVYSIMELIELQQALPMIKHRKDIEMLRTSGIDPLLSDLLRNTNTQLDALRKSYTYQKNTVENDSIAKLIHKKSVKKDSLNSVINSQILSSGGRVDTPLDTKIIPEDIEQQLGSNECLLYYILKNETLHIILKSAESEKYISQANVNTLEKDVTKLRYWITNPAQYDRDSFDLYATSLYVQLFGPLEAEIKEKDLAIVPSGIFNFLPFEILKNPVGGDYVLQDHAVRYLYSLKAYQSATSRMAMDDKIAFSPDFGDKANQAYAIRDGADALAGAAMESAMLSDQFSFDLYQGKSATKSIFLQTIGDARFIHIASHAQINEHDPMSSFILFDNADSLSGDDQKLYAYELYNLSLDADLAVLSACNTGIGKQKRFNGVISLARAFQFAGVRSTVMSLWPAQDESTSKLMELFYQNLDKGLSKSSALRQAKLSYLESADELHSQPFYWAAFVVQGSNDPVPNEGNSWPLAVGGLLLAGLLTYFIKRKSSSDLAA